MKISSDYKCHEPKTDNSIYVIDRCVKYDEISNTNIIDILDAEMKIIQQHPLRTIYNIKKSKYYIWTGTGKTFHEVSSHSNTSMLNSPYIPIKTFGFKKIKYVDASKKSLKELLDITSQYCTKNILAKKKLKTILQNKVQDTLYGEKYILQDYLVQELKDASHDIKKVYIIDLIKPLKRPKMKHRTRDMLLKHTNEVNKYLGYQRNNIELKNTVKESLNKITNISKTKEQKDLLVEKIRSIKVTKFSLQKVFDIIGKYYSDHDSFINACATISTIAYLTFILPYLIISRVTSIDVTIPFWIFTTIFGGIAIIPIFVLTSIKLYEIFWKFPKRMLTRKNYEQKN